jgi:hypothetical protein
MAVLHFVEKDWMTNNIQLSNVAHVKPFILITFFVLQDNHGTKVHDHQATMIMDLHISLNPMDFESKL